MAGARHWTTLDAALAYWSMPSNEVDKEKTAFGIPHGKFEFNVTPYGLCNAGSSYQQLMDLCLSGLPADQILAYMDDIAIYSTTFEEHLRYLEAVFLHLHSAGISLKASKCIFTSDQVEFLGYELSANRIKPQDHLTEAIHKFPRPTQRRTWSDFWALQVSTTNLLSVLHTYQSLSVESQAIWLHLSGTLNVIQPVKCSKTSYVHNLF